MTGEIYIGALNFNIFINDLLFFSAKYEICNFADDNSLYSFGMTLGNILSNLINDKESIHEWFVHYLMKSNPDKFQFIILGNKGSHTLQINDITTLLDITIDSKRNIRGQN